MKILRNKKAQALVEMAVFGSFVLLLFGTLLSYLQQFNNTQYVKMEAFRRALEKACTLNENSGGSVKYMLMQRRRMVDMNSGFRKRTPSNFSGSANVFWTVPKVGDKTSSTLVFRVNEDEIVKNYRDYIAEEYDEFDDEGVKRPTWRSLDTNYIDFSAESDFDETIKKGEDSTKITNEDSSNLREKVTTEIKYNIKVHNGSEDNYTYLYDEPQKFWTFEQGLYRDDQYRYSNSALSDVDAEGKIKPVTRTRIWETPF